MMRTIPAFTTEAEEAVWLYERREELGAEMLEELRAGRGGEGSVARLAKRRESQGSAARFGSADSPAEDMPRRA